MKDPFRPENYSHEKLISPRDILVALLNSAEVEARITFEDITEVEFHWEPIPVGEREGDIRLPPERKRVWRVFEQDGRWTYDYALGELNPPPFTTIAWIMNHVAQTAEMYLHCVQSGEPEGKSRTWDDLPVFSTIGDMRLYNYRILQAVRAYLVDIPEASVVAELNKFTPAPWGEMRPTYLNLIGGVIQHYFQHTMQVAVRKERIREKWE
jgi:hypothetical protein